jgi:hypothetical protein
MVLLRIMIQVVLFFLLLGAVIGLGSPDTGPIEKAVLVPILVALVWAAVRVRGLGRLVAGD